MGNRPLTAAQVASMSHGLLQATMLAALRRQMPEVVALDLDDRCENAYVLLTSGVTVHYGVKMKGGGAFRLVPPP